MNNMGVVDSFFNMVTFGRYGFLLSLMDTHSAAIKQMSQSMYVLSSRVYSAEKQLEEALSEEECDCDDCKKRLN